jgi:YVTN family beta-propeller protein
MNSASILVIDTGTGTVSQTITIGTAPRSIAIPANPSPANTFGYVTTGGNLIAIDLRPGLTFGQVVQGATVSLPVSSFIAANSDGSRVVVTGFGAGGVNVAVVDTALLLTNPSSAVISQVTIGANPGAVAISTITTQAPATAPIVSGFDANVVNDAPHTVQITGSNFSSGAQVRFGKLDPVPANVISSGILQAVVPQYAPAQTGADIIVTNPNSAGEHFRRTECGRRQLLAAQFGDKVRTERQQSLCRGVHHDDG